MVPNQAVTVVLSQVDIETTELLHNQAVELLHQRTQLMHRLRDIADAAASLDNLAERSRHRSHDRGYGLSL